MDTTLTITQNLLEKIWIGMDLECMPTSQTLLLELVALKKHMRKYVKHLDQ